MQENKTYTLFINSNNKISGSNNNANYQINFDFLPHDCNYFKIAFSFNTASGYYKDNTATPIFYGNCKIVCDFDVKEFTYDTSTLGKSLCLGYAQRDNQTSSGNSAGNTITCFYSYNTPKTICRPNKNVLNIQIYNLWSVLNGANTLLTDTNNSTSLTNSIPSADMTPYSMIIEFIPLY